MKNLSRCLLALTVTTSCFLSSAAVHASEQVKVLKGQAVTGVNRVVGVPTTDYGEPLGAFGFYNMAVYNPNGDKPILLTSETPDDAVLATVVDPAFLIAAGLPLGLIDESLNNIPLLDVGINVSPDGETRATLPSTLSVDPLEPSQAEPMDQVTLKDWLSAKGKARISCTDEGNSISIKARHLLPNRLYTIWGVFETADGRFNAVTIGGTPNAVSTDKKGRAKFERELGFCPFERTESGARLLAIDVVYHSDHQVYGTVPSFTAKSFITGTVTHSHLEFTVAGEPINN